MNSLLHLRNVSVARSGFKVVNGVELNAAAGEITVLLGANGAGKTTLLEGISGAIPIAAGSIHLGDSDIGTIRRERRARRGLAHVEQGRTVFDELTTEQNLLAAAPSDELARAYSLFPALHRRSTVKASQLSGGEQQMLVLARALLTNPTMVLLDEISLGLAPSIVGELMPVVRDLADSGVGVLLVEQFAHIALNIGDRAYVLDRGKIAFEGTCAELRQSPELLQNAYLARSSDTAGSTKGQP